MKPAEPKRTLLIIDDDQLFTHSVREYLTTDTLEVLIAHSGSDGLNACRRQRIDVVLLDQRLPDAEGHTLCPRILDLNEATKIIFVTAFPSFDNAMRAIDNGAFSYLPKPVDPPELKLAVEKCFRVSELEKAEVNLQYRYEKESAETVLIGDSPDWLRIRELIDLASRSEAPVLISGETGTGKNVTAKAIHFRGKKRGPFLAVNCAALPENLIEAELFGYEKGAYTGAAGSKKGLFEIAEDGTILLDEIAEMSPSLQAKLLGVLDDKKIRRIGGVVAIPVKARVIASTNADIETRVKNRLFRDDLYFRLNVIRIQVPVLRQRTSDIPKLANYFASCLANKEAFSLSQDELQRLSRYQWPGNIRELRNIIERASILSPDHVLRPSQLLPDQHRVVTKAAEGLETDQVVTLAKLEETQIRRVLQRRNGNLTQTARELGISLSTLKRKIKGYHIR